MLQEYVAGLVGVPVGTYYQFSNNLHAYMWNDKYADLIEAPYEQPYGPKMLPYPLFTGDPDSVDWEIDLRHLTDNISDVANDRMPNAYTLTTPFFKEVAEPMWKAWVAYKQGREGYRYVEALSYLEDCQAADWKEACIAWIHRRWKAYEVKSVAHKGV